MASRISLPLPVSVPDTKLNFWLTAIRAALGLILDEHSIVGDVLQTQQEELIVAVVHQLAMAEQGLQEALGQEVGYALANVESPAP